MKFLGHNLTDIFDLKKSYLKDISWTNYVFRFLGWHIFIKKKALKFQFIWPEAFQKEHEILGSGKYICEKVKA